MDLITIAKKYLKAIEDGKTGEELSVHLSEKIIQTEYPNSLTVNGATSTLTDILESAIKGQKILVKQRFGIVKEYTVANTVIFEMTWTGIFTIPFGKIEAGEEMKAHFAIFIEFENDKIIRQRNYDCFLPFR